ncbi:MAG: hypothetical protein ACI9XU_000373 [Arenicella sp.]
MVTSPNDVDVFLDRLENPLPVDSKSGNVFLMPPRVSLINIAILPFVRQFSAVDKALFKIMALP